MTPIPMTLPARIVKAPGPWVHLPRPYVFLAGSIEMGAAEDWQSRATEYLRTRDFTILNPRRDDWDSSWVQSIRNAQFREQVEWELTAMQDADRILMYFDPATKSPITLLELGLFAGEPAKLVVCCPEGFWRRGNVEIVCAHYSVPLFADLRPALESVQLWTPRRPIPGGAGY